MCVCVQYLCGVCPLSEEVQEIMAKRRKECSSLAQWEDKMHEVVGPEGGGGV